MGNIRSIPDFEITSIIPGVCFVYRGYKGKNEQVFRLGEVDMERGWVDIGQPAAEEIAGMLGWIPPGRAEGLVDLVARLKIEKKELEKAVNQSTVDVVVEVAVKLASEKRKVRRYKEDIAKLEKSLAEAQTKLLVMPSYSVTK